MITVMREIKTHHCSRYLQSKSVLLSETKC